MLLMAGQPGRALLPGVHSEATAQASAPATSERSPAGVWACEGGRERERAGTSAGPSGGGSWNAGKGVQATASLPAAVVGPAAAAEARTPCAWANPGAVAEAGSGLQAASPPAAAGGEAAAPGMRTPCTGVKLDSNSRVSGSTRAPTRGTPGSCAALHQATRQGLRMGHRRSVQSAPASPVGSASSLDSGSGSPWPVLAWTTGRPAGLGARRVILDDSASSGDDCGPAAAHGATPNLGGSGGCVRGATAGGGRAAALRMLSVAPASAEAAPGDVRGEAPVLAALDRGSIHLEAGRICAVNGSPPGDNMAVRLEAQGPGCLQGPGRGSLGSGSGVLASPDASPSVARAPDTAARRRVRLVDSDESDASAWSGVASSSSGSPADSLPASPHASTGEQTWARPGGGLGSSGAHQPWTHAGRQPAPGGAGGGSGGSEGSWSGRGLGDAARAAAAGAPARVRRGPAELFGAGSTGVVSDLSDRGFGTDGGAPGPAGDPYSFPSETPPDAALTSNLPGSSPGARGNGPPGGGRQDGASGAPEASMRSGCSSPIVLSSSEEEIECGATPQTFGAAATTAPSWCAPFV